MKCHNNFFSPSPYNKCNIRIQNNKIAKNIVRYYAKRFHQIVHVYDTPQFYLTFEILHFVHSKRNAKLRMRNAKNQASLRNTRKKKKKEERNHGERGFYRWIHVHATTVQ